MQTLAYELTTTLVEDAVELATGFGRIIVQLAKSPIERIARASDVAGILEQRRMTTRASKRRNPRNRRLSPFSSLSELT